VQLPLSLAMGRVRLLCASKVSEVNPPAVGPDVGDPLSFKLVETSAREATSVVPRNRPVLAILGGRAFTKISNSIVVTNAIYVVNLAMRPPPVNVQPRKVVSWIASATNHNSPIAMLAY
jgi:hypothetical protein